MLKIYNIGGIRQSGSYDLAMTRGAYVVQNDNGNVWLLDTGMMHWYQTYIDFIKNVLNKDEIEGIVISHFHHDHHGGAGSIIEGFDGKVKKVYSPKVYSDGSTDLEAETLLKNALSKYDIPHEQVKKGDLLEDADLKIDFLNPIQSDIDALGPRTGANSRGDQHVICVIAKVVYGDFTFMFTGDAFPEVQERAYSEYADPQVKVYQNAHHGDPTYLTDDIMDMVSPDYAISEAYGGGGDMQSLVFLGQKGVRTWTVRYNGRLEILANKNGSYRVKRKPTFIR